MSSVGVARKVSPNCSQERMTCHSSNCFSIVWGQGNAPLVTSVLSSCFMSFWNSSFFVEPSVFMLKLLLPTKQFI